MKFSVADLLDQLSYDQPVPKSTLAKILKLTNKADRERLDLALDGLSKLGLLSRQDDDGVVRDRCEDLFDARLRCSSKGFCFAIRDDGGDDIYIRDHQLNHAWNGDRVLVRVTREGGRRRSPEGGVQCILERSTQSLLAQVERQQDRMVAAPLDDRMLTSIELPADAEEHLPDEEATTVVEVKIDRYPVAQLPAQGHVARPLPLNAGPAADRNLLLTKAGLHERPAAPRGSVKSPASKGRTDLSEQPSLLLSGWQLSDAPPLPAVHVEARDGGSRLWLHAPSVAERFGQGNSLDLWIRERAEAICLGEEWQPLLTPAITKACCFKAGEASDAITVRLDIDADGNLADWEFMLSTIRPVADISAIQLRALAERKPKSRSIPAALKSIKDQLGQLETLLFCADCLMAKERADGSVALDLRPPQMEALGDLRWADPSGQAHRWGDVIDRTDPNSILQPLLRAADRAWGQHRAELQLPGISRISSEPDPTVLTDVAKTAVALDLPLELDDDGSPTAQELITVFAESDQRRVLEQQLSHALAHPQFQAEIKPQEPTEDGNPTDSEAAPAPWCCASLSYAHLANQQVIQMLLSDGKDRPNVRQKERLNLGRRGCAENLHWALFTGAQEEKLVSIVNHRLVQRLNSRRRQVLELLRDLQAMVQARSAEPLVGQDAEGRVSGVQSYGFFVEVGETRVEGLVHVSSLNDDWYEYRSRQNRLVGRKNRRVYQLGDPVRVRVIKVDVLRNQIDLEVIPEPAADRDDSSADSDATESEVKPMAVTLSNV
ncbi:MAG: RNB domain-containing ribonuclease [Synechococcus sp. MED-G133]|jgi:ribonuclease R|uniref:RNB domain-containing ribonuclease n=1 Tax=Synechococcus sp. A15-28 TaxID=1050638 RepID=UPI001208EAAE|nr:RNB domain-containing ribonuclease [Synechococcus sp. A15-28]QNI42294.1 exoribonuclease R [Synechococcus sp. A15-28]RZO09321.1 MAG: RNB domain-containing ribonuclease [Synechococcus sp. MED-G133]